MNENLPTLLVRETPSGTARPSSLPPELLASARARLGKFALFMAALFLVVMVFLQVIPWDWAGAPVELRFWVAGVQLAAVGFHLVMYWIVRAGRFSHAFTLRAGLIYEVVLCLAITVGDQWLSYTLNGRFQDLTFAALIIVIYPLFVPSPPRRTFVSALAASATLPLGIWVLSTIGQTPESMDYLVAGLTSAICVAIAVFGSVVIHGLHRAVAEARQLGSYRLETLLGRGGMGEVWRAKHRLLARPAAVKVVRPEVLGAHGPDEASRLIRRFEREAQATAGMCSPHTIALYDFGVAEDGTFYYVMELLDGLDLGSLVDQHGPVTSARAARFLTQMCDSLGEAHESGLIHRDVKPANIYVCRYGRRADFVKVLDFGLVKPSGASEDSRLTQEQVIGGTPAFMAPEQVLGDRPVDGRTDVYAAGCVAYWLLTGRLVFEGSTVMETMMHHVKTAPVPPSQQSEMAVPAAMDEIVLSCLEKDPAKRPQTADELDSRLTNAHLEDDWTAEHATRWWDRHRPAGT